MATPDVYQIRVKGHLGPGWSDWFDGWRIVNEENGEALLIGPIADQAALHGLLTRIRDLGLPLIEVSRIGRRASGPPDRDREGTCNG